MSLLGGNGNFTLVRKSIHKEKVMDSKQADMLILEIGKIREELQKLTQKLDDGGPLSRGFSEVAGSIEKLAKAIDQT